MTCIHPIFKAPGDRDRGHKICGCNLGQGMTRLESAVAPRNVTLLVRRSTRAGST